MNNITLKSAAFWTYISFVVILPIIVLVLSSVIGTTDAYGNNWGGFAFLSGLIYYLPILAVGTLLYFLTKVKYGDAFAVLSILFNISILVLGVIYAITIMIRV